MPKYLSSSLYIIVTVKKDCLRKKVSCINLIMDSFFLTYPVVSGLIWNYSTILFHSFSTEDYMNTVFSKYLCLIQAFSVKFHLTLNCY